MCERVYDLLILDGGADKVVTYVGAIDVFRKQADIDNTIRTVIGCSAGALIGLMFCLKMTRAEMEGFIQSRTPPDDPPRSLWHFADELWQTWGLLDSGHVGNIVRELLYMRLNVVDCTLCEFSKRTGKHLMVCASNVTDATHEMFSLNHHADISLVQLMCMTTCIPVLFKPVQFADKLYVDGFVYAQHLTPEIVRSHVDVNITNFLVFGINCSPMRLTAGSSVFQYLCYMLNGLIHAKNCGTLDSFSRDTNSTLVTMTCGSSYNIVAQTENTNVFSFLTPCASRVKCLSEHGAACAARVLNTAYDCTDAEPPTPPER